MKMEPGDVNLRNAEPQSRRVTRQSTKEVALDLKPREPLKRRRRDGEHPGGTAVNGSEARGRLPSTDADEPPKKRRSMQSTEDEEDASSGSEDEMDLEADGDDQDSDENREMSSEYMDRLQHAELIKKSSVRLVPLKGFPPTATMVTLEPQESGLRSRRSIHQPQVNSGMDAEAFKHRTEPSKRGSGPSLHVPTRPVVQKDVRTEAQTMQSSIRQYHSKMQEGLPATRPSEAQTVRSSTRQYYSKMQEALPGTRPSQDLAKSSRRNLGQNQTQNNIYKKELPRKAEVRRAVPNAKTKIPSTGGASGVYALILWLFLLCVSVAVAVLAYQRVPWSSLHRRARPSPEQEASLSTFSGHLRALEQHFPSQGEEFWRRSRIHLQRHLQTAQPTEPVSFILAGGRGAEVTLACLAARLASAFSSSLNGSVLELDSTGLAGKDSDQVKLELDNQLKEAFEGDKPAAVIHRLEELPPSSTLIFYRYCDHENAAYKHPLLAFTVLLPQDAVGSGVSLPEVEEMVHSHIHQKFLIPNQPNTFDTMDVNKLSGLWSRISHLVLPVNAEEHVEKGDCRRD